MFADSRAVGFTHPTARLQDGVDRERRHSASIVIGIAVGTAGTGSGIEGLILKKFPSNIRESIKFKARGFSTNESLKIISEFFQIFIIQKITATATTTKTLFEIFWMRREHSYYHGQ